jgi:hypothetical protein
MRRCPVFSVLASWAAGGEQSPGRAAEGSGLQENSHNIQLVLHLREWFTSGLEYQFAFMLVVEVYKGDKSSHTHLVELSINNNYLHALNLHIHTFSWQENVSVKFQLFYAH